ncbi:hypothetical protein JCM19239_1879 [Vibrio variabilis]|uniref:HTH araC/xylS-type domain-containing protein n=1 Tax=Vibrio variabilis TaxID=990271 RepID=A0ABQ0J883_9VIBR|nr:hypothetical protein JCM19239_1879 [Vibrio variabilis]
MLVDSDRTVAEVAYQIGYKDPHHFSRDFKNATGQSPKSFRCNERAQL